MKTLTAKQVVQKVLEIKTFDSWEERMEAAILLDRIHRAQQDTKITPPHESSELQGAIDRFDEATTNDDEHKAALGLREIVNEYLVTVLSEVDGV